jgi:hypothetical protein
VNRVLGMSVVSRVAMGAIIFEVAIGTVVKVCLFGLISDARTIGREIILLLVRKNGLYGS